MAHPGAHRNASLLKLLAVSFAALSIFPLTSCGERSAARGHFDKSFIVTGPVRLEISNGSGSTTILTGPDGEVRVSAEFRLQAWPWESASRHLASIQEHPPVEQQDNTIHIKGLSGWNGSVDYQITVPVETQVHSAIGSGTFDARGIRGPLNVTTGSGDLTASNIGGDIQVTAGSGDLTLSDVSGNADITAGSGDIQLRRAQGALRLRSGSGDLTIEDPGRSVIADTGSGDIKTIGAKSDLRLHSSSGDIDVTGAPGQTSYWDLHTSSGKGTSNVPSDAGFRFFAHTSSGSIATSLPIVIDEKNSSPEIRAHAGAGEGRIEVGTSSGDIDLH